MALTSNPLIVLGTFRGGTSCVATAINHLGVFLGDEREFQPASEQNPGGFWELRDMQKLNATALLAFGMDYFRAQPLPIDWKERPGGVEIVDEMRKLLNAKFGDHELWGWKEPSATVLMPLYIDAMSKEGVADYSALICVRHPLSVAASQRSRYKKWGYSADIVGGGSELPVEARTVGLWVHNTLSALRDTKGAKRLVVIYESFLHDPTPYVQRISDRLMGGKPDAAQRDRAIKSVDPELSHSKYGEEVLASWPSIVGKVFELTKRIDADADGFEQGKFDEEVEALYREWVLTSDLAKPFELPAAKMNFVWMEGEEQKRTSQPYIQASGWQIVRAAVPAPPGTTIQIDPCQLPCRIWIKRAVWMVGDQEFPAGFKPGPNGVLERHGWIRLSVLGPAALMALTPQVEGTPTLELEMLVESGEQPLREMIMSMAKRPGR